MDAIREAAAAAPVTDTPLLEKYHVLLSENAGVPPVPCVAKGDKVKKYQLIAEHNGFVSADLHAPTSGVVNGIVQVPGPMGIPAEAIEILAAGYDHECRDRRNGRSRLSFPRQTDCPPRQTGGYIDHQRR